MNKLYYIFEKCIFIIAAVLFVWIVFLLVLCENFVEYACKREVIVNNFVIIIAFLAVLSAYYYLRLKIKRNFEFSSLDYNKVVNICTGLFFLVQIYVCYNIFFVTGWDSGAFIVPAAGTLLGNGDTSGLNDAYFSVYPNNLLIVNIYCLILKINRMAGVFKGDYQLMSIVICNCAISSLTCRLLYQIGVKKFGKGYAFVGYAVSFVLIGLSPWMVICYSDSFALFMPILIIYIYMNEKICYIIKYVMIFVVGYLGYCIKPQVIIVVIAILGVEIIKRIGKTDIKLLKRDVMAIGISIAFILCLMICMQKLYESEGFDTDSNKKFGLTHFFMMGLNPDRLGVWSGEDVQISMECENQKERAEKNIEVSKKRLKEYGLLGYMEFLSKKMLTNYNDGTFAWGVEGGFYSIIPENINTYVSVKLKEFFYNDGSHYWLFSLGEQCIWILTIILVMAETMFAVFARRRKADYEYVIFILSIIGITIFELMFEARARYVYIYAPMFLLVAIYGFRDINEIISKKGEKKDEEAYTIYCDSVL